MRPLDSQDERATMTEREMMGMLMQRKIRMNISEQNAPACHNAGIFDVPQMTARITATK
jgi:hypothetical protein